MIKSPLGDSRPESEKLFGFYRGVVEDNNDPEKAGRVRVRIFGVHTSQLRKTVEQGIPSSELPWAEPCLPIVEGSISGFGIWGVPLQGSHVMIFFEANNISQPRYFASMPGIPESQFSLEADTDNREQLASINLGSTQGSGDLSKGFRDPSLVYPLKDRLGEPDVDRLARGVTTDTPVEFKNSNRTTGVSKAGGGTWDEPVSPYAAEYPDNTILQTHGGTLIELDSTSGEERIHLYHPSKSYIEIDANGVMVVKNTDKKYEIVVDDKNINIQGDNSETINGDDNLKVDGDVDQEIDGDLDQDIGGNVNGQVDGNVTENITGNLTVTVGGNITINSSGPTTITAPTVTVTAGTTTVNGGTVNLAADQGALRTLMNELTIALYNSHTHWYDPPGGGPRLTFVPNQLLSATQTTADTSAS